MDLPLVIEIVDSEEKINSFLPMLDEMVGGGLVTTEKGEGGSLPLSRPGSDDCISWSFQRNPGLQNRPNSG